MLAQQLVRDGDPQGALAALQDAVRKNASDVKLRILLFQMLSVLGQWERALTQLNVAAEMDASALPMAQTYRTALQCEALRVSGCRTKAGEKRGEQNPPRKTQQRKSRGGVTGRGNTKGAN